MYNPKAKVIWFAVTSRLGIILLQFIFNLIIPDHDAGVFLSPTAQEPSFYDNVVSYLFGGLCRWDAQHFLHIANYGYTYEHSLAFSPLYPMVVRYTSIILKAVLFSLNEQSAFMISAVLINFLCFVKSAAVFYDLSKIVLKDTRLAYKAAILYCINPASIFFSAFYSESMFACLSFQVMIAFAKNNPYIYLPIGLSVITRSNGLLNIGFPVYSCVRSFLKYLLPKFSKKYQNPPGELPKPFGCSTMFGSVVWLVNIVLLSIAPYVLLQLYNYSLFCLGNQMSIPYEVLKYGLRNGFVLAGTENPPWCESSIPIAYSYIQAKYWEVGFLKYYIFKNILKVFLGFPIVYIILSQSLKYLNENRVELCTLGSFTSALSSREKTNSKYFPSASPLLYWYCALNLSDNGITEDSRDFEYAENLCSKWKVFFLSQKHYNAKETAILSYFFGYIIVGCIMFSNFLPWT